MSHWPTKDNFDDDLKLAVSAFKAACYFDPSKIRIHYCRLKSELPMDMEKAEGVSNEVGKTDWWK